jgi:hypothetical protein
MLDSVIGFRNGILEFADDISELEPLLAQVHSILIMRAPLTVDII